MPRDEEMLSEYMPDRYNVITPFPTTTTSRLAHTLLELQAKVDEDEELDLSNCGLESLPEAVSELVGLRNLNLRNNKELRSLPAGLGSLAELEMLDLRGCEGLDRGKELHALVVQLQQKGCKVRMTRKKYLDPTLAELQADVDKDGKLNLSTCELWLPNEVGNLVGVNELDLSYNMKSFLPAGLWSLAGLEVLNLTSCGLEPLPEEVGMLVGLKKLYLRGP
jgi:hypothetical protein